MSCQPHRVTLQLTAQSTMKGVYQGEAPAVKSQVKEMVTSGWNTRFEVTGKEEGYIGVKHAF